MITVEQLKERIQFIATRLNAKKVDILLLGGKNLEGLMKSRRIETFSTESNFSLLFSFTKDSIILRLRVVLEEKSR